MAQHSMAQHGLAWQSPGMAQHSLVHPCAPSTGHPSALSHGTPWPDTAQPGMAPPAPDTAPPCPVSRVPPGTMCWSWTSSLRHSTTKPLSRRKPMTLLGFLVTPLTFQWGPKGRSSGSQPWEDRGLVGEGSHRAAASHRLAEGWNAADCPLSRMFPTPSILPTLPHDCSVPYHLAALALPTALLAHFRLPVGCTESSGDHLLFLLPRGHRGADGPVHRCQHPHHLGDPGLHL